MKFSIKKGHHYSKGFWFGLNFTNKLSFSVKFDENCLYKLENSGYASDINKLYGLADSYNHMKHSIRIGWRCIDGKNIQIFSFAHVDGKMVYDKMIIIKPNELFNVTLTISKDKYYMDITYNNKLYSKIIKRTSKWFLPRYHCKFYFGGNATAPQDMSVTINDTSFLKILI